MTPKKLMSNDKIMQVTRPKFIDALLQSFSEGLVAYGTLESRMGMGGALCESSFYMPLLKIAKHLGWKARVELPIKNHRNSGKGDWPRVDFYGYRDGYGIGIEVKFLDKYKKTEPYPDREVKKLNALHEWKKEIHPKGFEGYRLIVGRANKKDEIENFIVCRKDGKVPEKLTTVKAVQFDQSYLKYYCVVVRLV